MKQRQKKLVYAYANSPAADKYNNGNGCWLVYDDSRLPPIPFSDSEKMDALSFFEQIKLPVNTYESFTRESAVFTINKYIKE